MSMTHTIQMTPQGLEKIRVEYEVLRNRYRSLSRELHETALGSADDGRFLTGLKRVEHEFLYDRLKRIEEIIHKAKLLPESASSVAEVGSHIQYEADGIIHQVTLVESIEADPASGRISVTSPLGSALEGTRSGDKAPVEAPRGQYVVQVVRVY